MTLTETVLQILPYIGIWSLDPTENTNEENQRGLQDGDKLAAIIAVNQAYQKIFDEGPRAVWEHRFGMPLYAPATITADVTEYSTAVVFHGLQDWMKGCTISISGDDTANEIVDSTTLLRPYMGTTASGVAVTVYCDSLQMPAYVASVLGPIEITNVGKVLPADSRETFRYWSGSPRSGDQPPFWGEGAYVQTNKFTGDPRLYMPESQIDRVTGLMTLYVRLNPMPARKLTATIIGHLKAPVYTVEDLDMDDETPVILPLAGYHESIVLPFAKKKFMAHATFDSELAAQEVNNQYAEAQRLLLSAFTIRTETPDAVYR